MLRVCFKSSFQIKDLGPISNVLECRILKYIKRKKKCSSSRINTQYGLASESLSVKGNVDSDVTDALTIEGLVIAGETTVNGS